MRYYHMIVESNATGERREYISTKQGEAPHGYKCVGVCGYHDKPRQVQKPCIGCVYYAACSSRKDNSSYQSASCLYRKPAML